MCGFGKFQMILPLSSERGELETKKLLASEAGVKITKILSPDELLAVRHRDQLKFDPSI